MPTQLTAAARSATEALFIDLFSETFGPEKAGYLYIQYPFADVRGGQRFIDFALKDDYRRVAFEVDGERFHNPSMVSQGKYADDLLKQNSMVHLGWRVFRWTYMQLEREPAMVQDDLRTFLGDQPLFREFDDNLPVQRGKVLELKEHQQEALAALALMRENHETIALLYHATGTGKTVTAVSDAKRVGGRTLFLAHTKELVAQAAEQFRSIWPEAAVGLYAEGIRQRHTQVVCGSVQSVSQSLDDFGPADFDYVVIDECHHGAAETYQRILSWFTPKFTIGLTATPERADGDDLLKTFRAIAHRLDLKTAVEIGELVPVRCLRIRTNLDLSAVRFAGFRYNVQELESTVFVPERNRLIVDTWVTYVKDQPTVIFCVSVAHADALAAMLRAQGVAAKSVSGSTRPSERKATLADYEAGRVMALCACDLLNEGWDSPHTRVLFMARPTMSKTIYMQQLGRGMRLCEGKEYLLVFDFVDNAAALNNPYSLHRMLQLKDYRPGSYVLAPPGRWVIDETLYNQGDKPDLFIDYPVSALDFETIDLFNWQDSARSMVSQLEFVRRVSVQSETVERYIKDGKLVADLEVPMAGSRVFRYFTEEAVARYAKEHGWTLITAANRAQKFREMVDDAAMSYSYKPVFLVAFLDHADEQYRARIEDVAEAFADFYEERRRQGLPVETAGKLARGGYTQKDVEGIILSMPFKRFEDMGFMHHAKQLGTIELDSAIARRLTADDVAWVRERCRARLAEYYEKRFGGAQAQRELAAATDGVGEK